MTWTSILLIAVALALDALAVSLALGAAAPRFSWRRLMRVAGCFGGFQALMPVLGWLAGASLCSLIASYDHWVAFVLLAGVGTKMLRDSCRPPEELPAGDPAGLLLLTLGLATSLDALAVGLSLALLEVGIWLPALVIGAVTLVLCAGGVLAGRAAARRLGRRAELAGGLILWLIGARLLVLHLVG